MPLRIDPGNALCCTVNAHRSGWTGEICSKPSEWNCQAKQSFRDDYCAQGDDRCFHLKLFASTSPSMVVEETGASWILDSDPHALDDQILIVYGRPSAEPRGVREGKVSSVVYGGYRIREVTPIEFGYRKNYRIEPYPDSWFRVPNLGERVPYFRTAGGKYIKQIAASDISRLLDVLATKAETAPASSWIDPKDKQRLTTFRASHAEWLEAAAKKVRAFVPEPALEDPTPIYTSSSAPLGGALSQLGDVWKQRKSDAAAAPVVQAVGQPPQSATQSTAPLAGSASAPLRPQLIEASQAEWISSAYGQDVLQALRTAAYSKPFVILRGDPGVGKSHLALRLMDDPQRERTRVVPVSATWRGREDLLGYVNPVTGWFEATPFTLFLASADRAWSEGDRRPWLVVFEEFNLSQPEHWLSDVLAITQFHDPIDRQVHLGGKGIKALEGQDSVTLSPALSFLATVNTDHTTRPLSPRVLDRSALVSLSLDPRGALRMCGLNLAEEEVRAIEALNQITRQKGAAFSVRTAGSLQVCLNNRDAIESNRREVLDLVLSQELLSKVRLLARDPFDEAILDSLNQWSQEEGSLLPGCALLIEQWKEQLVGGQDVVQA